MLEMVLTSWDQWTETINKKYLFTLKAYNDVITFGNVASFYAISRVTCTRLQQ